MSWLRRVAWAIGLALCLAAAAWFFQWNKKGLIPTSGGLFFPWERLLDVPQFSQGDPRWGNDSLGDTEATLAQEGCAVASAAMVLAFYGADTDPGRLNRALVQKGGYTERGWIYWEKAAETAQRVQHVYEDLPSYRLIDMELLRGNPVIVRVRFPSGVTHFVVITGKHGFEYLIRDPAAAEVISKLGSYRAIEALRFYRRDD